MKVVCLAFASLLALVASVGAAAAPAGAAAAPTIAAPPNVVVGEADGSVKLPVTLNAPSTNTVSVNFSAPGNGCNYPNQATSGTLTFAPGVTTRTVTVTLNNCHTSGFQYFTFTLSGAVNGVITDPTTQVDVVGDPAPTSTTPGLYVRDAVVDASAGSIDVPVLLGGPAGATSSSTVTVKYATTNGSAVAGTDYAATSGTLTFGPGETVKNVVVPIIDRSGSAPTRRFGVVLSSPNNAVITDGTGVVTVGTSGATPVATPNISAPANLVVGEADGYVDLPVTLSAPSTNTVSVNFSAPGNGCNYPNQATSGTLTFVPGQTTQAVRVFLNNCHTSGFQYFTFTLSSAVNGSILNPTTPTQVDVVGDPAPTSTTPGLYVRDAVVDASAGSIDVPVLLGGPAGATSSSTVTVKYATTNGSAVAGTDYAATSGTLTFGPGETVKNVVVPIIDRSGSAPTRRFGVVLSSPNNAVITDGTGVVTVGASGATPVATPNIAAPANLVVGEADGYVDLPVTLSAPSTNTVSVNFSAPGNGCNYPNQATSGTLTFVPGQTTQAVRVFLNNCHTSGFQYFTFTLSSAVNGSILNPTTPTQVDVVGDPAPTSTTPGLYVRDAVVDASAGSIDVPVLLGGPAGATSSSTVTVKYATTNGSAVAGTDYAATSGTLTFGPGETVKNVVVPIIDRSGSAPTRRFGVVLSSPNNAVITDGTGVVTVGTSGATPVATPNIAAPANLVVGEADGYVDLPVTLSAPSTNTVSVNFSAPGNGCNYPNQATSGTLTFVPGQTTQAVRVFLNNCHTSGFQYFTFTLSSAVNGSILNPTTPTQVDVVGDPAPTSTTPGLYVRDAVVDASAGSIDVPVLLGGPAGATSSSTVTVKYATTNGSAVAGTDYAATSGTLTFGPGETVKNVVVPIIDRSGSAPTRRFGVVLSSPNNAVITDGTGVVTVGASGATPVATPNIAAPANLVVGEADGYVDLPVTLSAPSTNTVSVNFSAPGNGCNYPNQATSGTLTFVPGQTTQAVRVFLNNCGVVGSFTFTLSGANNGTITQSTTTVSVPVSNTVPGSPTAVKGVSGNGYVTVRFTAPKSDGGDPVNSYTVTASPGGMTATGIGSPIIVVGLTNGTAYTFKVTATNPEGTSKASSASAPVTPTGPGFAVATTSLPSAARGEAYGPVTLAVSGTTASTPPHTTTVAWAEGPATSSGPGLPQGLHLSASGVLSGTPSSGLATGTYTVCVKATETVTTVAGGKTTTSKTIAYGLIPLSIS